MQVIGSQVHFKEGLCGLLGRTIACAPVAPWLALGSCSFGTMGLAFGVWQEALSGLDLRSLAPNTIFEAGDTIAVLGIWNQSIDNY